MGERILVTGGAGFIGSAVCRLLVQSGAERVVNLDKLTYSGNLASLDEIADHPNYHFVRGDIGDEEAVAQLLADERIGRIMHLAAESHVDRSIDGPAIFLETNILGTFHLLNAALRHFRRLDSGAQETFRFHHVSTDEVFGDLPFEYDVFTEESPYKPSSPYSASKASSDHLVKAWHQTFGLPVVLSNCSNNYGPYHFPEKLIPLVIINAIEGRPLPVYGSGSNVRDWLYVEDHARALVRVVMEGKVGQTYCIGGRSERTNLQVVKAICAALDKRSPREDGRSYDEQVEFVADRPGHDRRYAIDPTKIERELGWLAEENFETGLAKTVDWYLAREDWWRPLREQSYSGERLGTGAVVASSRG